MHRTMIMVVVVGFSAALFSCRAAREPQASGIMGYENNVALGLLSPEWLPAGYENDVASDQPPREWLQRRVSMDEALEIALEGEARSAANACGAGASLVIPKAAAIVLMLFILFALSADPALAGGAQKPQE